MVHVPDIVPSISELWTPVELENLEAPPVRKSIQVVLNARTFYVNKSFFHEESEIGASLTASSEQSSICLCETVRQGLASKLD